MKSPNDHQRRGYRVSALLGLLVAATLDIVVGVAAAQQLQPSGKLPTSRASAAASTGYDCGDITSFYGCDALTGWVGPTDGAYTEMSVQHISGGDGRLVDYLKVADSSCRCLATLEAGVMQARSNNGQEVWYWKEVLAKPFTFTVRVHYGLPVAQGDYGYPAKILISRVDAKSFAVTIGSHTNPKAVFGLSTQNTMRPDRIYVGAYLSGDRGVSNPLTTFANNQYKHLNGGSWHEQLPTASGYSNKSGSGWYTYSTDPLGALWDNAGQAFSVYRLGQSDYTPAAGGGVR
jgi:hypothetical protein